MRTEVIRKAINKMESGSVIGVFMKSTDPAFVEAAGLAGMDFVILDLEHGPSSFKELENNLRASEVSEMLSVVRLPNIDESNIGHALDAGADAIQISQIETSEQARQVVELAKFHPQGMRGVCRFVRAAKYSNQEKQQYFKAANETLIILQVEGITAINNIDDILLVEGIDVIFIGPYDLSQSLGIPGLIEHPKVIEKVKDILLKANRNGKKLGIFVENDDQLRYWKKMGIQYLAYSVDVGIFSEACKQIISHATEDN